MIITKTIQCDTCKQVYEFEEEVVPIGTPMPAENLPDGYLIHGEWICDECGSCPECGREVVEKELDKAARVVDGVLVPAQKCSYCIEEV